MSSAKSRLLSLHLFTIVVAAALVHADCQHAPVPLSVGRMDPRFSFVIPACNQVGGLGATLACLEAQTFDSSGFECIFVDDASSDGTADALERWKPPFATRVLRNPKNVGRSTTRNRGWQAAKGDIIVFIDGDMLVHPNLLAEYERHFASGEVDVVSGRRLHFDLTRPTPAVTAAIASLSAADAGDARLALRPDEVGALLDTGELGQLPNPIQRQLELEMGQVCELYPLSLTRGLSLITSNVAISKSALSRAQGFCPFFARGQDTELGIRLARMGARFRYAPGARAVHLYDWRRDHLRFDAHLRLLVKRHPYLAVVAWYVWSTGHSMLPSLLGIARAEFDSALASGSLLDIAEGFGFPKSFLIESDELIQRYAVDSHARELWKRQLARAEAIGVAHSRVGTRCLFDHDLLMSWLQDERAFEPEGGSRSMSVSTSRAFSAPRAERTWVGTYKVSIPVACIPREQPVVANLALPIGTDSQTVSLTRCSPSTLLSHRQLDMVVNFPVVPLGDEDVVELSYDFECRVTRRGQLDSAGYDSDLSRPEGKPLIEPSLVPPSRHLNPSFPRWTLPDLRRLLRLILPEEPMSEDDRAREISSWLLAESERSPAAARSYVAAQTGIGAEAQLTSLFVNLCQLAGLPARERCSARLDESTAAGVLRLVSYRSPFIESAPEVWLRGSGWTRFDLGQPRRVPTAPQAARVVAGPGLAPDQIDASIFCSRLPTLATRGPGGWAPLVTGLAVTHRLSAHIVQEGTSE